MRLQKVMSQSQKLSVRHHDCRQLPAKGWLEATALPSLSWAAGCSSHCQPVFDWPSRQSWTLNHSLEAREECSTDCCGNLLWEYPQFLKIWMQLIWHTVPSQLPFCLGTWKKREKLSLYYLSVFHVTLGKTIK